MNRFKIFVDNLRFIEDFNHSGNRTFKLGLNAFSDLTVEEFLAIHTGLSLPPVRRNSPRTMSLLRANVTDVPDSIDWVEKGAVNAIKKPRSMWLLLGFLNYSGCRINYSNQDW